MVVLSVVRRLTKSKVAVSIGVSSELDFGLDWEMKKGRLVRMLCWMVAASVCTVDVMVLVRHCSLFGRMVCVVVIAYRW